MEIDYIIVGAGLAGISIGLELHERGKKLLIIDEDIESTSSKIAAGIVNPIVPKRILKTWMCDEIIPRVDPFYKKWESLCKAKFYDNVPILQIHSSAQESNEWASRYENLKNYIQIGAGTLPANIIAPFGYSQTLQSGRLNVAEYCKSGLRLLQQFHTQAKEFFQYSKFYPGRSGIFLRIP